MTKEPKLQVAQRLIPEWKDYDNEIKNLMEKCQEEEKNNKSQQNTPILPTNPSKTLDNKQEL
jgi:hypothetical protein